MYSTFEERLFNHGIEAINEMSEIRETARELRERQWSILDRELDTGAELTVAIIKLHLNQFHPKVEQETALKQVSAEELPVVVVEARAG